MAQTIVIIPGLANTNLPATYSEADVRAILGGQVAGLDNMQVNSVTNGDTTTHTFSHRVGTKGALA